MPSSNYSVTTHPAIKRTGFASVKQGGLVGSWKGWATRQLILDRDTLIIHKKDRQSNLAFALAISSITTMKRTRLVRRPYVIQLAHTAGRLFLSFETSDLLNAWLQDMSRDGEPDIPPSLANGGANFISLDDNSAYETTVVSFPSPASAEPDTASSVSPSNLAWTPKPFLLLQSDKLLFSQAISPDHSTRSSHIRTPAKRVSTDAEDMTSPSAQILHHRTPSTNSPVPAASLLLPPTSLDADNRSILRTAVSLICSTMEPRLLRKSEPGGEKPFDLVELRLRALLRLQRKWKTESEVADELGVFADALVDGYVLCRLMNTLHSDTIIRPGTHDPENNTNVEKFLSACLKLGLPRSELFHVADLTERTPFSLSRVARTVVLLIKFVEDGTQKVTPKQTIQHKPKRTPRRPSDPFRSVIGLDLPRIPVRAQIPQSQDPMKVYPHLSAFLMAVATNSASERLIQALQDLSQCLTSLAPIPTLVRSGSLRVMLLRIAGELGVSNDPMLQAQLHKDDWELRVLLKSVVLAEPNRATILELRGDDAQSFVDLIQTTLDRATSYTEDDDFVSTSRRLLVRLSESRDVLPSSLFIQGIERQDLDPCCCGTFGDIYRGSYRGDTVALKRIRVFQSDYQAQRDQADRRKFCREALMWQRLRHPYVLPFVGIDNQTFPSFLCMVAPWMPQGTILKHLSMQGIENVEKHLFEIAQGLEYLHSQEVVHGDLRGVNILVDESCSVRLADFGLAVFSNATGGTNPSNRAGSVRWMAPESHDPASCGLESFQRTFASDVYSFACVCVELYTGLPPFSSIRHDPAVLLKVVIECERPPRPPNVPDHMWKIIESCWQQDMTKRPTIRNVVDMMQHSNPALRPISGPLSNKQLQLNRSGAVKHRQRSLNVFSESAPITPAQS